MKSKFSKLVPAMAVLLLFAMLGGPEMLMAQSSPQHATQSQSEQVAMLPEAPMPQQAVGTPALPQDAQPEAQQNNNAQEQNAQNQNNAQKQKEQNPVGAAAAQKAKTAGGAASKPAGNAIAPAKQRQVRSLLIKLGLIAAGGAAIGTVYALSRGTASTPPGSGR